MERKLWIPIAVLVTAFMLSPSLTVSRSEWPRLRRDLGAVLPIMRGTARACALAPAAQARTADSRVTRPQRRPATPVPVRPGREQGATR